MKVSVLMITYNHEEYVAQAVESVLSQETDFYYELVIGEDCSTDNTREILLDLRDQHPDKIRLLPSEMNLGMQPNFVRTFNACKGQYVAILEGDDYWLQPNKLQIQVEYLERHPACSFCFTDANMVSSDGQEVLREGMRSGFKEILTLEDLVERDFVINCTAMYRRGLHKQFPDWFMNMHSGAWAVHVLNAEHGYIGFIDEIAAAYRQHPGGVYSSLDYDRELQYRLADGEILSSYLDREYADIIQEQQDRRWKALKEVLIEKGYQLGLDTVSAKHVSQIFDTWPPDLALDNKWKSEVLGAIYERLLFKKYQEGDFSGVRYSWLKLVRLKPKQLVNLGVLSIGIEVFIGRAPAKFLRGIKSRLKSKSSGSFSSTN